MGTPFGRLAQSFEQYKVYRTTLNELNNLGDREINDLGLKRSEFRTIAHKAAYRR
ncbi:MAG: DUF1127 domain-containing protein [Pseudomonadota bacterium]